MGALVTELARAVAAAGGRAYEVGGTVRDRLLGRTAKDEDLEVYGLSPGALEAVIARFGTVRRVGARLGVYVLRGVEVALPQGPGGVEDPHLTPEQAARRRDLTINALLRDPLSGEILDFHGGRADLQRGVLRPVAAATFVEDPLRLLRVVRLHAGLGFRIHPTTAALCRGLSLQGVAWERIGQELAAWLVRAPSPERGLDALLYTGAERQFPALYALRGCPVGPGWAAGADAWSLTRAVLAAAGARRTGERERDWPLMLAALLQAVGRPGVTRHCGGAWRAPGAAGAAAARVLPWLHRVDRSQVVARPVRALVAEQASIDALAATGAGAPAYRRLAARVDSDLLLRLAEALHAARHGDRAPYAAAERARTRWLAEDLLGRAPTPLLQGRDVQALGVAPGPAIGRWLEAAFQAQLDGAFTPPRPGAAAAIAAPPPQW
ncbi:MAG TPA: CCA tRNA nucleotidyltransferase [Gammaproteobacteria bacterium]|nr:CCA tRNA nucleotidyltransferase [Gammaproteobacteria bacterium]